MHVELSRLLLRRLKIFELQVVLKVILVRMQVVLQHLSYLSHCAKSEE